jgi:hypothetical protein
MCAPSRFLINKRDICLQLSRLFRRFSMSVSDLRFGFPSTSQLPQRSTSQLSPRFSFPLSLNFSTFNESVTNVSAFQYQLSRSLHFSTASTLNVSTLSVSAFSFPLWVSLNFSTASTLQLSQFQLSVFRFGFPLNFSTAQRLNTLTPEL